MSVGNNRTPAVECVPLKSKETYYDVMEGERGKMQNSVTE